MGLSVGGLVSGLDSESLIGKLMELERRPIVLLQQREAAYQVKLTAYGSLKSVLSAVQSAAEKLMDVELFNRFQAVSSDETVVGVSAADGAVPARSSVSVQQLAASHKIRSQGFSAGEALGEGMLRLRVGDGPETEITVSATDTIQDVARAINKAHAGVSASVIFDGSAYYLSLSALETGEVHRIQVSVTEKGTTPEDPANADGAGLSRLAYTDGVAENMTEVQAARDAEITVDGIGGIRRPSNTVDDVLPGITLTLKKESPEGTSVDVTGTPSTKDVKSAVEAFVKAYNDFVDFMAQQQAFDAASQEGGTLLGDATANGVRNRLRGLIATSVSSGVEGVGTLSSLGISVTRVGKLQLDAAKLDRVLRENPDAVRTFFAGDGETVRGFAEKAAENLKGLLDGFNGMIAARTKGLERSIDSIQDQIQRMEDRLLKVEERYRNQFNALEAILSSYTQTSEYLAQQIQGLQNLNKSMAK